MSNQKLPRGHAFIHFRSASMTVKLDFPRVEEPFVDEMRKLAIERWIERTKPQETPLSECVNPECPVGCPDSHAATPEYIAMVEPPEEDDPLVQEVKRG